MRSLQLHSSFHLGGTQLGCRAAAKSLFQENAVNVEPCPSSSVYGTRPGGAGRYPSPPNAFMSISGHFSSFFVGGKLIAVWTSMETEKTNKPWLNSLGRISRQHLKLSGASGPLPLQAAIERPTWKVSRCSDDSDLPCMYQSDVVPFQLSAWLVSVSHG